MGVSPKKKRRRRGLRPSDRRYLDSRCERCGASLADALNAPSLGYAGLGLGFAYGVGLCAWCEWQWAKLENE